MKENKGITLIALVITIIVLLILAGVSIAMLGGDNGLFNKANKANQATIEAEVRESVELAISAEITRKLSDNTSVDLSGENIEGSEVATQINNANGVALDDENAASAVGQVITYKGYRITLTTDGKSIEVNGINKIST